jgi:UrcA family protein
MRNLTPYVAIALITTLSFNMVRADTYGSARSETVRFSGIDINSSSGAEILYRRLNIAANNVCRGLEPDRSIALVAPHRACIRSALSKALVDVGNPALLAYAAAHGTAAADVTVRIAQSQ